jgi:flagellar biosynthesis chaperone FliJ
MAKRNTIYNFHIHVLHLGIQKMNWGNYQRQLDLLDWLVHTNTQMHSTLEEFAQNNL